MYTVDGILFSLKKELLTCATWMSLEDIMLCESSPSQKDKYCRFHLYELPRVVKFTETESKMGEG